MLLTELKITVDTRGAVAPIEKLIRKEILDGNFHCQISGPEAESLFDMLKHVDDIVLTAVNAVYMQGNLPELAVSDLKQRLPKEWDITVNERLLRDILFIVRKEMLKSLSEYLGYVTP